jgi:4-hydroxybenzoate polyprenyltransferase
MAGLGQPTKEMCFVIKETAGSPSSGTIAGIFVLVFFIFMVLTGVAVYYIMKSKKDKEDDLRNGIVSYNPYYHSMKMKTCFVILSFFL